MRYKFIKNPILFTLWASLSASGFALRASGFALRASGFALRASGFALRATTRQDDPTRRPDKTTRQDGKADHSPPPALSRTCSIRRRFIPLLAGCVGKIEHFSRVSPMAKPGNPDGIDKKGRRVHIMKYLLCRPLVWIISYRLPCNISLHQDGSVQTDLRAYLFWSEPDMPGGAF